MFKQCWTYNLMWTRWFKNTRFAWNCTLSSFTYFTLVPNSSIQSKNLIRKLKLTTFLRNNSKCSYRQGIHLSGVFKTFVRAWRLTLKGQGSKRATSWSTSTLIEMTTFEHSITVDVIRSSLLPANGLVWPKITM